MAFNTKVRQHPYFHILLFVLFAAVPFLIYHYMGPGAGSVKGTTIYLLVMAVSFAILFILISGTFARLVIGLSVPVVLFFVMLSQMRDLGAAGFMVFGMIFLTAHFIAFSIFCALAAHPEKKSTRIVVALLAGLAVAVGVFDTWIFTLNENYEEVIERAETGEYKSVEHMKRQCNGLKQYRRSDCLAALQAREKDTSICDEIKTSSTRYSCHMDSIHAFELSAQMQICQKFQDPGERGECVWKIAVERKDETLCTTHLRGRDDEMLRCISEVASATRNISLCGHPEMAEASRSNPHWQNYCQQEVNQAIEYDKIP